MKKTILFYTLLIGCYKNDSYDIANQDVNNLFTVTLKDPTLEADGTSKTTVIVDSLPEQLADSDNKIILVTDKGSFENGSSKIEILSSLVIKDGSRIRSAQTTLRSDSTPGTAHIKITLKDVSKIDSIQFVRAYPDSIKILLANPYAKAGYDPIGIDVLLPRSTGVVSKGTAISLKVVNSSEVEVGQLQQNTAISNGDSKVHFTYFFTDTSFQASLKVKAFFQDPLKTFKDSAFLTIHK